MDKSGIMVIVLLISIPCWADRPPPPPTPYVIKGACPFECCTYRTWSVEASTTLYSQPDRKSKVVGKVKAHESVDAITGEVHATPTRFIVNRAHESDKPQDVLWVYSYEGEGHFKVLRNGELVSENLSFSPYGGTGGTRCQDQSQYCWGTLENEISNTWWVKVETKTGVEGWSDEPNHFGNKDACG